MHFDGSKLLNGSGAGVLLQSPKGDKLHYVLQIHFEATNNMAEYEALIHGLRVAKDIGIKRIVCSWATKSSMCLGSKTRRLIYCLNLDQGASKFRQEFS